MLPTMTDFTLATLHTQTSPLSTQDTLPTPATPVHTLATPHTPATPDYITTRYEILPNCNHSSPYTGYSLNSSSSRLNY